MVLVGRFSQEYLINAGVPQGSVNGPIFLLYINGLSNDLICNIAIASCADDPTLYYKCDQASDLWQRIELGSELESWSR